MAEELLNIDEVGAFLKVSRDTVYRMAQKGQIPTTKVGNQWRFRKADVVQWLETKGGAVAEDVAGKLANTLGNEHRFAVLVPNIVDNPDLRDPQLEGFVKLDEHFRDGTADREVGVVLPVGCGKSGLLTLAPFATKSRRALVVAPGLRISAQLLKEFEPGNEDRFYSKCKVLRDFEFPEAAEIRGKQSNTEDLELADVVVTNIQQLQGDNNRWLQSLPEDFFDMILFDEGHHNVAESWQILRDKFPAARIVNFSATPTRADGQRMQGEIVYQYPVFRAIEKGYVKRLKATVLNPRTLKYLSSEDNREIEIDLDEVKRLAETDSQFRRGIVSSPETLHTIVDASIKRLNELKKKTGEARLKIIASALNQKHCIQIKQAYSARGLRAEYLHSNEDGKANEKILKKLENHELDVIIQVRMLGEGFDHPHLAVAAVFSIFRSLTPFAQFIGRVMRSIVRNDPTHPLNEGVIVFHAGSNVARVWDDFREFSQEDRDFYDELLLPTEELPFDDASELEVEPQARGANGVRKVIISGQGEIQLQEIPLLQDTGVQSALKYLLERGLTADQFSEFAESQHTRLPVTKQAQRQADRKALDEQIQLAAGTILKKRKVNFRGTELDKPLRTRENFQVVKSALDKAVNEFVGRSEGEREQFSHKDYENLKNKFDEIADKVEGELFNG